MSSAFVCGRHWFKREQNNEWCVPPDIGPATSSPTSPAAGVCTCPGRGDRAASRSAWRPAGSTLCRQAQHTNKKTEEPTKIEASWNDSCLHPSHTETSLLLDENTVLDSSYESSKPNDKEETQLLAETPTSFVFEAQHKYSNLKLKNGRHFHAEPVELQRPSR